MLCSIKIMEKSEPSLVPEWLRCTTSGGGTSTNRFASSSSKSDVPSCTPSMRNRLSRSTNDKDKPRSIFPDRSTLSNSRRNSVLSGSTKHPYISFARSQRVRNHDKDKERSVSRDLWDYDYCDPLGNSLRHSQSMISRGPKRALELTKCNKAAFEKDFPSLGTEEKPGVYGVGRVLSPLLCTSIHSNSGLIGGEGWTSALAEVPIEIGSRIMGTACVQQTASVTPTSAVGPNMAETLSQAISHVPTTPPLPDKSQRLEDLAIRQSRQLIPMTHATSKPLGLSSTDRSKYPKIAVKTGEINATAKSETSYVGKFHVLKPLWENSVSAPLTGPHVPVVGPPAPMTGPEVQRRKALTPRSTGENKPSFSRAKSRSDFFNLMRKKNKSASDVLSPTSGMIIEQVCNTENGDSLEESQRFCDVEDKSSSSFNEVVYPNEEEAAFLRSLGWEEDYTGDDEGLTEEEINAFYQEYMNLMPSLKVCRGVHTKFGMLSEAGVSNLGGPSSKSESIA